MSPTQISNFTILVSEAVNTPTPNVNQKKLVRWYQQAAQQQLTAAVATS